MHFNRHLFFALVFSGLVLANGTSAQDVSQAGAGAAPSVRVQTLENVQPFRVGTTRKTAITMPLGEWRGTDAATAKALLADVPEAGASPLLNALLAGVLISPAMPPKGADAQLASARLETIYRLGLLQSVVQIAERSPGGLSEPENAAIAAQAMLAMGQDERSCETASRLRSGREAIFWLKLRAFCLARSGKMAAARLTADLALEADPDDTDFLLALNRLLVKEPGTQPIHPGNVIELAIARAAGAAVDTSLAPLALQISSVNADNKETALGAVKRAVIANIEPANALAKAYLAFGAPETPVIPREDDFVTGDGDAAALETSRLQEVLASAGPMRAAGLYRLARQATAPSLRAEAIKTALADEHDFANYLAAARLYGPQIRRLQATPALADYAPVFMQALMAFGDYKAARTWAALISPNPAQTRLLALIQPQARLADKALPRSDAGQIKAQGMAYRDLMALSALGKPLSAPMRQFLFSHTSDAQEYAPCPPGALIALADGARAGAQAATIIRAAELLVDAGFEHSAPQCGGAVISALRQLHLDDVAQAAAVEMLLAARFQSPVDRHAHSAP